MFARIDRKTRRLIVRRPLDRLFHVFGKLVHIEAVRVGWNVTSYVAVSLTRKGDPS